jgi:hypothetical protein
MYKVSYTLHRGMLALSSRAFCAAWDVDDALNLAYLTCTWLLNIRAAICLQSPLCTSHYNMWCFMEKYIIIITHTAPYLYTLRKETGLQLLKLLLLNKGGEG